MKIKCPHCNRDKYTATKQLDLHMEHYHLLIEKIHEKIEECKQIGHHYDAIKSVVDNVLKSLLENEK